MILDSLFRIVCSRIKKNDGLPEYVTIQRDGFRHKYHINEIVRIASKVIGKERSVGIKDVELASRVLMRARDAMFIYRQSSPVACWALNNVEKVPVNEHVRVVDLRKESCNVEGLALPRLLKALDKEHNGVVSPQNSMAAVKLLMATDLVIVDTPLEAQRIQGYLAERILKAAVAHSKEIEGYYTPPKKDGVWSEPFVAQG